MFLLIGDMKALPRELLCSGKRERDGEMFFYLTGPTLSFNVVTKVGAFNRAWTLMPLLKDLSALPSISEREQRQTDLC